MELALYGTAAALIAVAFQFADAGTGWHDLRRAHSGGLVLAWRTGGGGAGSATASAISAPSAGGTLSLEASSVEASALEPS